MVGVKDEIVGIARAVLGEQSRYLFFQNAVQLVGVEVFVACHACFDAFDDFKRGLNTYIAGDEGFFKVVQHFVIDFRLAGNGTGHFRQDALFRARQSLVVNRFGLCSLSSLFRAQALILPGFREKRK